MININNKAWEKLRFSDIEALLNADDDETMFFEFKNDKTSTRDFAAEICAFSNTYGGYLLIGIEDDKSITGCTNWTEQKIHTTIHDSVTPTPIFDVRKFKTKQGLIFVIRIEEGAFPPYITSRGKILQRISSGSFTIKDTYSLNQMFNKRKDNLINIEKKISIDEINLNSTVPDNLCAYLDLGFAPDFHDVQKIKTDFFKVDLTMLANKSKEVLGHCTISRLGHSLLITLGEISANRNGTKVAAPAGVSNFIEIMCDGSVRCRVCFALEEDAIHALVSQTNIIGVGFAHIYETIWGEQFYKNFISAEKYEKLVVLKQFSPTYNNQSKFSEQYRARYRHHNTLFGGNIIVTSNRIPKTDFFTIERRLFDKIGIKYNNRNLIDELFWLEHYSMGIFTDKESGFPQEDNTDSST